MLHLIVNWLLSAVALLIVAKLIAGFEVRDFSAALVAAAVIAIVNFFFGPILRFFGFPFIFLTLGLFTFVIDAVLLKLAAMFTRGFRIRGFLPALVGSIVLTVLTFLLRLVVFA
jgi:putative membrane protein